MQDVTCLFWISMHPSKLDTSDAPENQAPDHIKRYLHLILTYITIQELSFDLKVWSSMSRIAYYRVSTTDQSIESQRQALGERFDKEFSDSGVSGATLAKSRTGFSALLDYVREGDQVFVYALDRLGRDAIDVQQTVKMLLGKGVELHINGLGCISKGVGELIVAVLAQIAEMERQRITERCQAGRAAAKKALEETGKTHRGKVSLGRPQVGSAAEVRAWRELNKASISQAAKHFGISTATVSRYCRT